MEIFRVKNRCQNINVRLLTLLGVEVQLLDFFAGKTYLILNKFKIIFDKGCLIITRSPKQKHIEINTENTAEKSYYESSIVVDGDLLASNQKSFDPFSAQEEGRKIEMPFFISKNC